MDENIAFKPIRQELKDIEKQLTLKELYSLLGCARGLLKAQKSEKE